ncbi:hypothetical protein R1sor_011900 [Riccia sorocarpa]|uniref:Endonuclease/exonuclease/phosphatase domain-containing protein n=1 Tax=Riccia sorocarpa TaxID=122646 RepID=A0ABD3I456_9MARC
MNHAVNRPMVGPADGSGSASRSGRIIPIGNEAGPSSFKNWQSFTANSRSRNLTHAGSKGGYASDQEDAQTSEAWAEGISWHMLATELDTLQVAADFGEGKEGDIRVIELDVSKASAKLGRFRKTAVLLQALESSPIHDRVVAWVRDTMEIRLGVKISRLVEWDRRHSLKLTANINVAPLGQVLSQEAGGRGQSESIKARIVTANTGAEAGKDNATAGAKAVPDDTGFTPVPHKARSSLKDAEVRKGANNAHSPNRFQLLDTPQPKDIDDPQDETMQEGEISAAEAENPGVAPVLSSPVLLVQIGEELKGVSSPEEKGVGQNDGVLEPLRYFQRQKIYLPQGQTLLEVPVLTDSGAYRSEERPHYGRWLDGEASSTGEESPRPGLEVSSGGSRRILGELDVNRGHMIQQGCITMDSEDEIFRENTIREDGLLQGLTTPVKKRAVKNWFTHQGGGAKVIALQEVKNASWSAGQWLKNLSKGGTVVFGKPEGSHEGTTLVFHPSIQILDKGVEGHGRLAWAKAQMGDSQVGFLTIHAPNKRWLRMVFWEQVKNIMREGNWFLLGDFNQGDLPEDAIGRSTSVRGREERWNHSRIDRMYLSSGTSWVNHVRELWHHESSRLSDHLPLSMVVQVEAEDSQRRNETYFKMSFYDLQDPEIKQRAKAAWGAETQVVRDSRRRWARGWQRVKKMLKNVRKEKEQRRRMEWNLVEDVAWRRAQVSKNSTGRSYKL